jgi:signal peptidase I
MPSKKTKPPKTKPKTPKHKSGKKGSWFKAILIAIMLLIIIRVFIFQTFVIQSSSMSANLLSGDWVVINKLSYGSRLPITLLSIPYTPDRTSSTSEKYFLDYIQFPYYRLSGYSKVNRNDILAFNYPYEQDVPFDKKIVLVKRCMGLAGDTLTIKNNVVYVNRTKTDIDNIQLEYRVKIKNKILKQSLIDKYDIYEGGPVNNYGEYDLYLTQRNVKSLKSENDIISIQKGKNLSNSDKTYVFPHDSKYKWTLDNYGSIIVPKAGDKLELNLKNISIYRDLLEKYENCTVTVSGDSILINNMHLQSYYVKNNYYFVLDDNRDNAKDSRLWGFLPESHIIGKVSFIIMSFNSSEKKSIRWKRTFKCIEN